jgi:cysteine desulfurase/selenocysteine lyase
LVYFDNAATTLKPQAVIDRIAESYLYETSNVHRGIHFLSDQATKYFEDAREKVAEFINALDVSEIIFTSGTTESLNLVAQGFGKNILEVGDEVIVTELEHHSNFVPWQQLCLAKNAKLVVVPVQNDGSLTVEDFKKYLNKKTKIVTISHVSNTLGTILPVNEISDLAKKNGSIVVIDGAQTVAHMKTDVQKINCDFFAFSAHKLLGPTGIGVLYAKKALLSQLTPIKFGGGMVDKVTIEKTTFQDPPFCYEAGTPHITGAVGLAAAIDYIEELGLKEIETYEHSLLKYAQQRITEIPEVTIYGTAQNKGPILSFNVENAHSSDVASLLDQEGIAVRSGHHCTQPLMTKLCIPGTVRASFSFYNTQSEIDNFINSLKKVIKIFK